MDNWLSRVGLLLVFSAFWLVAPEFLGEDRLKVVEGVVQRTLKFVPIIGFAAAIIGAVFITGGDGPINDRAGLPVAVEVISAVGFISLAAVVIGFTLIKTSDKPETVTGDIRAAVAKLPVIRQNPEWGALAFLLFLGVFIMLPISLNFFPSVSNQPAGPYSFFRLHYRATNATVIAFMSMFSLAILFRSMANNEEFRQRSFLVGVLLFIIGFVLQFVSTFH
jgi:hypothetical protein